MTSDAGRKAELIEKYNSRTLTDLNEIEELIKILEEDSEKAFEQKDARGVVAYGLVLLNLRSMWYSQGGQE